MAKVALLGDSILDNKRYVDVNENSVEEHLSQLSNENFILIAFDGDTTKDVIQNQINNIDTDVTHIVLSIGGNDLLERIEVLFEDSTFTFAGALEKAVLFLEPIKKNYDSIINELVKTNAKILLCTIYDGELEKDPILKTIKTQGLALTGLLNDYISVLGRRYNLDVLELREIFTETEDYANPIEPSHIGGEKFARSIIHWIDQVEEECPTKELGTDV